MKQDDYERWVDEQKSFLMKAHRILLLVHFFAESYFAKKRPTQEKPKVKSYPVKPFDGGETVEDPREWINRIGQFDDEIFNEAIAEPNDYPINMDYDRYVCGEEAVDDLIGDVDFALDLARACMSYARHCVINVDSRLDDDDRREVFQEMDGAIRTLTRYVYEYVGYWRHAILAKVASIEFTRDRIRKSVNTKLGYRDRDKENLLAIHNKIFGGQCLGLCSPNKLASRLHEELRRDMSLNKVKYLMAELKADGKISAIGTQKVTKK